MMFGITSADLEAWQAFFMCAFGMTCVITPAVYFHFRREQTFEWRHEERKQELEFQKEMFETSTQPLGLKDPDADPSA